MGIDINTVRGLICLRNHTVTEGDQRGRNEERRDGRWGHKTIVDLKIKTLHCP